MNNQNKRGWVVGRKVIILLIAFTFTLIFSFANSQKQVSDSLDKKAKPQKGIVNDSIYSYAQKMPEFPGGDFALPFYVYKNTKYPDLALSNREEGCVMVKFIVNKKGRIEKPEIISKETSSNLNQEALRVVNSMPNFKPAIQEGKIVNTFNWVVFYFQLKPCNENEFYPIIITPTKRELPSFKKDEKGIYTFVEKNPQFPGGLVELCTFIGKKLKNPPCYGTDCGISGKVIIRFVIEKTGKVSNVVVVKSLDTNYYNQEAVRVIKMLPNFIPGEHNGKKVAVYYTIPVYFKLD